MSIFEHPINTLDGEPSSLAEHEGQALLLVNVASRCGLTPQYTGLEELQQTTATVASACSGSRATSSAARSRAAAEEIATFCSTTYGVTFPMFEKIDVNGPDRHPIYDELTTVADAEGHDGDIRWNFEKFLVDPDGIGHPLQPDGHARRPRAGRRHRGRPARLRASATGAGHP